ncbi:hypothetical protein FPL13_08855 [Streptococcus sp. KS 6]|nr:hypothetical protein FPL13_08855 [Streptococcus sp. KS 6]
MDMFIFLYTVFRNSSISDEHVFCVALHFTTGLFQKLLTFHTKYIILINVNDCKTKDLLYERRE